MNFEPYINLQNIFSFSELTFVENMTMVQEVPQPRLKISRLQKVRTKVRTFLLYTYVLFDFT